MALFRYRPKGNRTPLNHPVLGHLEWDGIYDNPACAGNPDFQEIKPEPEPAPDPDPEPAASEPDAVAPADESADKPSAQSKTDAGKTGRSKQ